MTEELPSRVPTVTFAPDDGEPATTIVKSVARVKNVDHTDLKPLHDVIDVQTLTGLLADGRGKSPQDSANPDSADVQVRFRYEGCRVTVRPGRIRVEPADSTTGSTT